MSEETVEVVRRHFAAFDRGDLDELFADLHPEVISRAHPIGEEYKGHGGFRRFIANWTEQFEDFEQATEEFIDAGDRVLTRVLQKARGRASGVPVEAHFWVVHVLESGKVTRVELFDNEARALEAAGLSE